MPVAFRNLANVSLIALKSSWKGFLAHWNLPIMMDVNDAIIEARRKPGYDPMKSEQTCAIKEIVEG